MTQNEYQYLTIRIWHIIDSPRGQPILISKMNYDDKWWQFGNSWEHVLSMCPKLLNMTAYRYGSIPIESYRYIFSGLFTSINPSYDLGFTRYQGFDPSPYDWTPQVDDDLRKKLLAISSRCRSPRLVPGVFGWLVTLWLCQNSYWKWPLIVDFPIKNGDFQ